MKLTQSLDVGQYQKMMQSPNTKINAFQLPILHTNLTGQGSPQSENGFESHRSSPRLTDRNSPGKKGVFMPPILRASSQMRNSLNFQQTNDSVTQSLNIPMRQYKVSIADMVESSKKTNDEWGIDGLEHPKKHYYNQKGIFYSISKDSGKPKDYISMLQKQKKLIPGPQYDVIPEMGKGGKFFISKGKIPTFFTTVQENAKHIPGVGKYDIQKSKFKILGNYTYKEEGSSFISAAIVDGQSTPAPYQAIDLNKIKDRVFSLKISKSGMNAPKKIEKNSSPSPHTYKIEEAYEKTARSSIKNTFSKKQKIPFFEENQKQKKLFPGVGKYHLETADKVLTLGLSKGWK